MDMNNCPSEGELGMPGQSPADGGAVTENAPEGAPRVEGAR